MTLTPEQVHPSTLNSVGNDQLDVHCRWLNGNGHLQLCFWSYTLPNLARPWGAWPRTSVDWTHADEP